MTLWRGTLAGRLFVLMTIVAVTGAVLAALFIVRDYRASARERLQDLLTANAFNLMGNVEFKPGEGLSGYPDLGDVRYNTPASGWYWSVSGVPPNGASLRSVSLEGNSIPTPSDVPLDLTFQRQFVVAGTNGQILVGVEAQVILGEADDLFSFMVTANKSDLDAEVNAFARRVLIALAIFVGVLVITTYGVVHLGLRPLARARESLHAVRLGQAVRIEGTFPAEIEPLVEETNALIDSNDKIVERARTQVGNLAHSLKTPLAVLNNEIATLPKKRRMLFGEQLSAMQKQVQVYLDRARISARSTTALARTPAGPVIAKLCEVVAKLSPEKSIAHTLPEEGNLVFYGEEHDLQELLGNLLENATRFAMSRVQVSARARDNDIIVTVEDDGEGMSEEQMAKAATRGTRVDEGGSGWGLGLSIINDIVEEYQGRVSYQRSSLGGLKASLELPGTLEA